MGWQLEQANIVMSYLLCSPSSFEKAALGQAIITAFPCLRDPFGETGYVSKNYFIATFN